MSERSFHFPVSILVRDAQLFLGALRVDIGSPVAKRLPNAFSERLEAQIQQVSSGASGQKAAAGNTGQLTQAQNVALAEVKRLTASARETAKLAYTNNPVLLHQEFQVGHSDPVDLATVLERAGTVQLSCVKYAAALSEHGWLADDTTALATAIVVLAGADEIQEASKGDKKAATCTKTTAANTLYAQCQSVQNAVELAYPEAKASTDARVVTARARFLMDTFPPRAGSADATEDPTPGTTTTPANAQKPTIPATA